MNNELEETSSLDDTNDTNSDSLSIDAMDLEQIYQSQSGNIRIYRNTSLTLSRRNPIRISPTYSYNPSNNSNSHSTTSSNNSRTNSNNSNNSRTNSNNSNNSNNSSNTSISNNTPSYLNNEVFNLNTELNNQNNNQDNQDNQDNNPDNTNNLNLTRYPSISSTGSVKNPCRICYQTVDNPKRYCKCTGSIAYIHFDCLMQWLQTRRNQLACEICHSNYFLERKLITKYFTKDNFYYVYYPLILLNLIYVIIFWLLIPSILGFMFNMHDHIEYITLATMFNLVYMTYFWIKLSRRLIPKIDYKIVFNPRLERKFDRENNNYNESIV